MSVVPLFLVVTIVHLLLGYTGANGKDNILNALSEIKSLRSTVERLKQRTERQSKEIKDLQSQTSIQELELQTFRNEVGTLEDVNGRIQFLSNRCSTLHDKLKRTERFLGQAPPDPGSDNSDESDVIAFYARMSQVLQSPGSNVTLIFDTTFTNAGDGYNSKTGVFTAPRDGFYVFLWKIRMYVAEHSTQLMVNGDVYGATFLRAINGDDGSVTGSVVAHLSAGDNVYVRVHDSYAGSGIFNNNVHGHSSFSGWRLN